jgi:hypothetical protein
MILVFKTSINTKKAVQTVTPTLEKIPNSTWNFDLDDCDKILRINSEENVSNQVISDLKQYGFSCELLE